MDAKQARLGADMYNKRLYSEELDNILHEVEELSKKGHTTLTVYHSINHIVKIDLEELGYIVESNSFRNEENTFVSW